MLYECVEDMAVGLPSNGKISILKNTVFKRHSETNHISQLSSLQGQQRKDKIN